MWKANGKTTTLSLFLQSLFPKTDVLEEAVDLSCDRLLMMMTPKSCKFVIATPDSDILTNIIQVC
jgi:hypothetical protein